MLQILDLANENAALKRELTRIRQEAETLRLLLSSAGASEDDGTSESSPRITEEV
jgi:hypothetical protein